MHRHSKRKYQVVQEYPDGSYAVLCSKCGHVYESRPSRTNQRKVLNSD